MGLLGIIIALAVALVVLELFKHHFTKSLFKYLMVSLVIIFLLLIVSSFLDLGSFFDQDNTFAKTGAVIAEDVSEDIDGFDPRESETLQTIGDKVKEFLQNLID
tara:strand:+ start:383 stop:694 length:312 start_codon:yes stop_codon:yes gene_type:complete